ncbi:polysaccharide biosynthesis/export family protein [Aureimonas phyllosphaerae]|uniref:Polysaccharide export outer membrane protein n=1 Tax=Aureimonas phyllosphaerae TaxID=1166078 RepID=A0A7W6BU20_9HYPH|nr:polysaccharide biosynthesis/export family protein [Aureimonas phyllosphaerae]MBB3938014.1 polysaccharide export outer membrane protein [Aureimonas phyllosphaerae]MBB3962021.1 polysaccharide export outer membrane protein [Aureimonas phyllosphaerae]SFF53970.1 polysaccharide export outer membrane protein [Aureimonas phyllosphaerae]
MRTTKTTCLTLGVLCTVALAGCTTLPRSGPDDKRIRDEATLYFAADKKKPLTDYVLVDLTETVLGYFPMQSQGLSRGFGPTRRGAPELPLGNGDTIQITLFESSAGGLFIPAEAGSRPGNFITLPPQTIDTTGRISVPYAGTLTVSGRTPAQVQADIEDRLANRAIEPQAIINLIEKRSSQVSVLGDVNEAARISLSEGGERVLDVISRAGGISAPAEETSVTLQRGGTSATVPFNQLVTSPSDNIFVYPNDTIYVNRERRTYLAFGASGLNGSIDFDDLNLSWAEGVGKAGGLLDSRADPGQVFLYRMVDGETLTRMGFPVAGKTGLSFPVIFRANLRDPSTFFLAQQFPMRDKDIIYVSNSDSIEVVKFLDIINSATSGVSGPLVDAASVRTSSRLITR